MLIHGFSLINARLLKAFGTAFYAITFLIVKENRKDIPIMHTDQPYNKHSLAQTTPVSNIFSWFQRCSSQ